MIVMIGGKAINPEHVSFVEYRAGDEYSNVVLTSGKYVEVHLPHQATIDAINEALMPRRFITGMTLTDDELADVFKQPGPLLALPASGDVDRDALIMHLANLINDHQNDLDFCRSTSNTTSGKSVAAACHERSVSELTDLLRWVKGES
jgi:hypothetical protein